MLVRSPRAVELLIWVVTLSIAFFGIKAARSPCSPEAATALWGPPGSMVEENNALAVALVMLVPFMYYLYQTSAAGQCDG
jgi:hypothetical protein